MFKVFSRYIFEGNADDGRNSAEHNPIPSLSKRENSSRVFKRRCVRTGYLDYI